MTSVQAERDAIGDIDCAQLVVSGIGRTNAAAATTEAILRSPRRRPFDAVINAGIAGSLPGTDLAIGDSILATQCVYAEEGLIGPDGFADMAAMGFALGDFTGNVVPVDENLLRVIAESIGGPARWMTGPIATVATCSGTGAAAAEVIRRTGALAEAMEGAAVVHAARRLHVPAIELRVISNTTGDRARQRWDLAAALRSLGPAVRQAVAAMGRSEI